MIYMLEAAELVLREPDLNQQDEDEVHLTIFACTNKYRLGFLGLLMSPKRLKTLTFT